MNSKVSSTLALAMGMLNASEQRRSNYPPGFSDFCREQDERHQAKKKPRPTKIKAETVECYCGNKFKTKYMTSTCKKCARSVTLNKGNLIT